ncbi:hypothetical protein QOZ80_3BG0277620 [Eleusine coracana subsp. coracana]|nr:hypothetical protein QOZ80_3BG0277620 [Eleusine coracana subsp. coracana]
MSHFGRSGAPEIRNSYSLLVLNVSFRTASDDLFPLFDRYGEVVDIHIPRDRRTGDSRGFAFVRYKYEDEAQMAVDKLDGRKVNGREIRVQFAKYGPNSERIGAGLWKEFQSQEVIPEAEVQDRGIEMIIGTQTIEAKAGAEVGRDMDGIGTVRGYHRRSRSRSISPDYDRKHGRYSRSPVQRGRTRSRSSSPLKAPSREVAPSRPRDDHSPCSRSPSAKA